MTVAPEPDRLRRLIDVVVTSIDDDDLTSPRDLAQRAYLSRFHFDRLFKAGVLETPHALRQRLLLERAAYPLDVTPEPVTEIAFDAGFGSLEAFTRPFRRAFGRSPSEHRRLHARSHLLAAPNGVHFHPPGGLLMSIRPDERSHTMDLTDRLIEHDLWLTRRIIEAAARLEETQLDLVVDADRAPQPWEASEMTVRSMLNLLVKTKEIWGAAIAGRECPDDTDFTIGGFERGADEAGEAFSKIVRSVRERGEWDTAFIDASCEPAETFTYGAMVAHVLTFNAARRQQLISALATLGIDDIGYGDPIEWERSVVGDRGPAG
jgi:AraC-like DNA-binding protein